MRKQDLLNAIDELDLKYVTQAWENTQPSTDEKLRLGDTRHERFAIFGAGIAAALLVGFVALTYMRGDSRLPTNSGESDYGFTPGGISETSVTSGETSKNTESTVSVPNNDSNVSVPKTESDDTSVTSPVFRTGELYAPDKKTFTYSEGDGECRFEGDGDTPTVVFDNFVYLGSPQNIYNSLTNPNFFVQFSEELSRSGVVNKAMLNLYKQEVPYQRFYVGDKYGDLTLTSAKTVFIHGGMEEARGNNLKSMVAEFEGTTKLPAIVFQYDGVYFAIPIPENVPGGGGNKIPAMSLLKTDSDGKYKTEGASTPISVNLQAYSDVVIRLNNPEEFGLADMTSGKGHMLVSIELGNIHVEYDPASEKRDVDLTTASIVNVTPITKDYNKMNYDKTTDVHSTIENYFRAYVSWSGEGHLDDLTLLSIKETTESVEKIREELSTVNPGETPQNPECAELIHDYEVVYSDEVNTVTATCRLIFDQNNTNVWAVISSQTLDSVPID